jgi:RNAse (barnase) inhibitor barstar
MSEPGDTDTSPPQRVQVLPAGATAAEALERVGRSLGWHVARIDLEGCTDKQELLGRTAAALDFPDWFGANWDALYDCLADLGWRPAPGHLLVFECSSALRRAAPEVRDTAVAILEDAAAAWASRGVPFRAVLLD